MGICGADLVVHLAPRLCWVTGNTLVKRETCEER